MFKVAISSMITLATSIYFLFLSLPQKSFYHSLFVSNDLSDNESISNHLYMLTKRPHIAGSEANAEAAAYVLSTLSSYNIPSHITPYYTALTYPVSRSFTLTRPPPETPIEFTLEQETYEGDPYAGVASEVEPTFHAYAKSGTAVGPVVYVNYGRVEDYETLMKMGVNVSGNVALARYGKIFRGDIVENAYAAGAIGVLIFTDRKDYGGEKWFPDDKWMPPSGVQVGSVYTGAGDPTTPGWPSTEECERISEDEVEKTGDVPVIPSLPISWSDGDEIIRSIDGQVARDDWQGGKDAPVYRVGPGPGILNLTYLGKQVISRIENVVGIIEGAEEPDRYVILGNHRDAWTFGAADPNSGTACLLEVAERFWKLQKKGWKPRRTIIFCNWDAEEYGLIGSTEWVEENRQMLASRVVAYLNVDIAVAGAGFEAYATPQLDELLVQTSKQVVDPDNSSQTIYDSWISSTDNPTIGRLGGGGSDYAAFVQHIGVPSADISFGGGYPVYHSLYDDFIWMKKFGDPTFQRHVAVASIWGLVALRLADAEILPFNYHTYALELQKSAEDLKSEVSNRGITLVPLLKSINELEKAAIKINAEIKALEGSKGWTSMWKDDRKVRELNDRLMMAERAFTDREGLSGRSWYKHLIYAPSKHNDYGSKSFPGIDDALEKAISLNTADSWRSVQHEIWRVSRVITQASLCLKGELK
ncbi:Transferrin receptor and related proteins containing the protease-associated (PA) domain [Handroanthus impetiginosus]|uniref:glutamate carboxypeptidase II n=1 Tax=Handroanthus impetiginosus TaxID=429701 RepID=A0A2G9HAJ9_9LAMI|nr:Transferrin receptor and related proteins containing the protease-associated (PA) domain [Handroanthus impetiginosus]